MNFRIGNEILFKLSTSGRCGGISPDIVVSTYQEAIKSFEKAKREDLVGKTILLEVPIAASPPIEKLREVTQESLRLTFNYSRLKLLNDSEEITLTIAKPSV